jgi:hypothetical protein
MALGVTQIASNTGSAVTSVAVTVSSTAAGSLIVVGVGWQNGSTSITSVTDNQSNTYVSADAAVVNGNAGAQIWYCENATGGVTSVTVTWSASAGRGQPTVYEISGAATANAKDQTSSGTGSGTALAVASFTPTVANSIAIAVGYLPTNTTWTAGTDYTLGSTQNRMGTERRIMTSASAQTAPLTSSASNTWAYAAATFKEAASGSNLKDKFFMFFP